jgi:hypothetical protein
LKRLSLMWLNSVSLFQGMTGKECQEIHFQRVKCRRVVRKLSLLQLESR